MIGIEEIGTYIPSNRISNIDKIEKFDTNEEFIKNKIGITHVALKDKDEDVSSMCLKAFDNLQSKVQIEKEDVGAIVLITQNPESNIPHSSALIHDLLDLPETCASFDVSLGCSGFVYGLSILQSFMLSNGIDNALLFTCDPYSKIMNYEDKNTSLLFGDAATVTLLSNKAIWTSSKFTFGTIGKESHNLTAGVVSDKLYMNGRGIFNFASRYVPKDLDRLLEINNAELEDIDKFIFHQGSKFIIDTLKRKKGLKEADVVFDAKEYGNTVSSSIPIILAQEIKKEANKRLLICGFGVGLSWSSTILNKIN